MQGKFWEMHDMIFENQKAWTDAFDAGRSSKAMRPKIGLNLEMFRRDIGSQIVERTNFSRWQTRPRAGRSGNTDSVHEWTRDSVRSLDAG